MPIVSWKPEYSVGINIIDAQHKKLIETINMLSDAINKHEAKSALSEVLNRLIEYATFHFELEEKYMIEFKYPGYDEHKKEHNYCTDSVLGFMKKFEAGEQMLPVEMLDFLVDWLHAHMLEIDHKYSAYFQEHGLK